MDSGAGWLPSDDEVLGFAATFEGELATGTPGPITVEFASRWLSKMLGRREFPAQWKRALVAEWRAACRQSTGSGFQKKTAGGVPAWKEAKLLAGEVEKHPANPQGANFIGYRELTAEQRGDFAKKTARLAALESTETA